LNDDYLLPGFVALSIVPCPAKKAELHSSFRPLLDFFASRKANKGANLC